LFVSNAEKGYADALGNESGKNRSKKLNIASFNYRFQKRTLKLGVRTLPGRERFAAGFLFSARWCGCRACCAAGLAGRVS